MGGFIVFTGCGWGTGACGIGVGGVGATGGVIFGGLLSLPPENKALKMKKTMIKRNPPTP